LIGLYSHEQLQEGFASFNRACINGNVEIVKLLMGRDDLNINTLDNEGKTAFHWACICGHVEIVKLLMDRDDVKMSQVDRGDATAFQYACKGGNIEIVKLLMGRDELKDDISRTDKWVRNEDMRCISQ